MLVLYPQVTYRSDLENTNMLSYHQAGLFFITNKATWAGPGTHHTVPKQLYINPLVRNTSACSPQTPLRNCTFTRVTVRDIKELVAGFNCLFLPVSFSKRGYASVKYYCLWTLNTQAPFYKSTCTLTDFSQNFYLHFIPFCLSKSLPWTFHFSSQILYLPA